MDSTTGFWVAIIAAIFTGLTGMVVQIVGLILQYMRDMNAAKDRAIVAEMQKAANEKAAADRAAAAHIMTKQVEVTGAMAEKLETVHVATNSMKDALIAGALVQGKAEGKAEAEAKQAEDKAKPC